MTIAAALEGIRAALADADIVATWDARLMQTPGALIKPVKLVALTLDGGCTLEAQIVLAAADRSMPVVVDDLDALIGAALASGLDVDDGVNLDVALELSNGTTIPAASITVHHTA